MEEIAGTAGDLSVHGLSGWLATSNGPMRYRGNTNPVAAIVRGHAVLGDGITGLHGATITRTFSIRNGAFVESTYSDELGNFLFAPIQDTFHYDYKIFY